MEWSNDVTMSGSEELEDSMDGVERGQLRTMALRVVEFLKNPPAALEARRKRIEQARERLLMNIKPIGSEFSLQDSQALANGRRRSQVKSRSFWRVIRGESVSPARLAR